MIMAIFSPSDSPTHSNSKCPAQLLTSGQRQQLAIQALSDSSSISKLSDQHQVSRKFLYQQCHKASNALDEAFSQQQNDDEVLFYIPVTKQWLKQVVLVLLLVCHSSYRGVIEFFRDVLDKSISIGTVHNIVHRAVDDAKQINSTQDLSCIRAGSHDELFQTGLPVLTGIDLDSTYCYLLALEDHRDSDTWGVHLLDLSSQGLHPEYTIADGGLGLRAGQKIAWPDTPCYGDTFHPIYYFTNVINALEKQAYTAIAKRDELEKKMDQAKKHGNGRSLSKQLSLARHHESVLIRVVDDIFILLQWMREDVLAISGLGFESRKLLYNFVMDELKSLEELSKNQKISKMRRSLEGQRDTLLGFSNLIDQGLQNISERFQVPVYLLRELMNLQGQPPTTPSYYSQISRLHHHFQDKFPAVQQAVIELKSHIHRASSMVENLNGRLRNYFFLRRQIGSSYLDLLRFFLNHHSFMRSKHPERVGKTPAQLLTGQPHPHWLELLGFTLFKRVNKAA